MDRGQLRPWSQPTVTAHGQRIPGLKLDPPRQLALLHALVRCSHVAAGGTFTTAEIHGEGTAVLGLPESEYQLGSVRYELSKLRATGLVERIPHSRRYRLLSDGYRICVVFLKLFERVYAPLVAGRLQPYAGDCRLAPERVTQLDMLYLAVTAALDHLVAAVGLKAA